MGVECRWLAVEEFCPNLGVTCEKKSCLHRKLCGIKVLKKLFGCRKKEL